MDSPREDPIDLDKILLPKKEVHAPENAERINAGVLLEQEQNATLKPAPERAPPAVTEKKEENSEIKPLQTYQGDIERLVQDKNVSVVSIAAAEAQRRAGLQGGGKQEGGEGGIGSNLITILGSVAISLAAGGLAFFAFYLWQKVHEPVELQHIPPAPFITVDGTQMLAFGTNAPSRDAFMTALVAAQKNDPLSLGLIERLDPGLPAQTLLSTLAPTIPESLLRTITPTYLLGLHTFDGTQPLLILSADSYEGAYAGMLLWEESMQNDLAPLFARVPSPHLQTPSTAATSTSGASSTPAVIVPPIFVDKIVQNHDARALINQAGDILLLWAFLDRQTLVITTNEYTLREVISRRTSVPLQPAP